MIFTATNDGIKLSFNALNTLISTHTVLFYYMKKMDGIKLSFNKTTAQKYKQHSP